ncbi:hypothetical protein BER2_4331 [plant metagenome]|uniref:Uncharacterized protein n=1 Tax=plant metagenome TaxID=1297885 RepID=A0A484RDW5_9ZZZZ
MTRSAYEKQIGRTFETAEQGNQFAVIQVNGKRFLACVQVFVCYGTTVPRNVVNEGRQCARFDAAERLDRNNAGAEIG